MYNLTKNNYHLNPKNSNIQTPPEVSQFIFELLRDKIPERSLIFDPCVGEGNLLSPFASLRSRDFYGFKTYGIDIRGQAEGCCPNLIQNFLT
jgi:type I restriction-modification system DNA methylase subunit